MLPFLISNIVQASVSMKRLSTFLQLDEIDPDNLETREQAAFGMYYSDVSVNDIILHHNDVTAVSHVLQVMRMLSLYKLEHFLGITMKDLFWRGMCSVRMCIILASIHLSVV